MRAALVVLSLLAVAACRGGVTLHPAPDPDPIVAPDAGEEVDAGEPDAGQEPDPNRLRIVTTYMPTVEAGKPYALKVDVVGGTPPYRFQVLNRVPGLDFTDDTFSGTPAEGGYYDQDVVVTDSSDPQQKDGRWFQFLVTDPLSGMPQISNPRNVPAGYVGESYQLVIEIAKIDSFAPIERVGIWWYLDAAPPGIQIHNIAGILVGRPEKAGTYKFRVHAMRRDNTPLDDKELVLEVRDARAPFSPAGLDSFTTRHSTVQGTSLPTNLRGHTVSPLPDGKVLITGGGYLSNPLNAARIFDGESFTPTQRMIVARAEHTATVLNTGEVLVVGGIPTGITPVGEIYNPTSGEWRSVSGVLGTRVAHVAAQLPEGKVLIAYGTEGYSTPWGVTPGPGLLTASIYDPIVGKFVATGSPSVMRSAPVATTLKDGRVAITGGFSAGGPASLVEIYDPRTGVFEEGGQLVEPRGAHTATLLPDGRVFVAAGVRDNTGKYCDTAEIWDPTTHRSTAVANTLFHARAGTTAVLLPGGKRVFIYGGALANTVHPTPPAYEGAELYDIASQTFEPVHTVFQRWGATSSVLPNGTVAIIGGSTNPQGAEDWRMLFTELFAP